MFGTRNAVFWNVCFSHLLSKEAVSALPEGGVRLKARPHMRGETDKAVTGQ
jgi:hypothetical protein